jgi:hypothetical protein
MESGFYKYKIKNEGDETVFLIFSMKRLSRHEKGQKLTEFLNGVTHSPTRFRKEVVVFDDRPLSIR